MTVEHEPTGVVKRTSILLVSFQSLVILSCWNATAINEPWSSAPGKTTEVKPTPIFIRLPVGTFDPRSQTGPMNLPENLIIDTYLPEERGYYIVQFKGPVLKEWKDAVDNAGGRVFDYIPEFAFIVKMDRETKTLVESFTSVRWIGIYQPAYRISPDLLNVVLKGGERGQVEVSVTVFQGEPLLELIEKTEGTGGKVLVVSEGKWKNKIRVRIEPHYLTELAKVMGVKWIEMAPEFELFPTGKKKGVE